MNEQRSENTCGCGHEARYHFDDGKGRVLCRATYDCDCGVEMPSSKVSACPHAPVYQRTPMGDVRAGCPFCRDAEIAELRLKLGGANKTIARFLGPDGDLHIDRFASVVAADEPTCAHPFVKLGIDGDGVVWCTECFAKPLVIKKPWEDAETKRDLTERKVDLTERKFPDETGASRSGTFDCIGCGEADVDAPLTYCAECKTFHDRIAQQLSERDDYR